MWHRAGSGSPYVLGLASPPSLRPHPSLSCLLGLLHTVQGRVGGRHGQAPLLLVWSSWRQSPLAGSIPQGPEKGAK